ncbi:hypothetical protein AB0C93_16195 [Streptomyces sp. NPDC048518]|uniref:hypothetical protein n=1 Tax=Streptomyces sp. NPDC048518 TaxID=3155029 RepID=UPI0033C51C5E
MKSDDEKLGYEPQVRQVQAVENEVNSISSRILDVMGIKGKTEGSGSMISACDAIDPDMKNYYTVAHPWSIYDLQEGTFEQAMQNLRDQLPKMGWQITKDGPTKSLAKNPEIVAVDNKSHHTVTIEWAKNRSGKLKELISIDVGSRCYKAPEGTDLSTER